MKSFRYVLAISGVPLILTVACIVIALSPIGRMTLGELFGIQEAHAATQRIPVLWEREVGREKITPTVATALAVPVGATHAEFNIEGGSVFVRGDGGTPADSATTSTADAPTMWNAFKWSEGHHRKEENDGPKLSAMRFQCSGCTVWVQYFRANQ